jgi:hypothetical protein
MKEDCGMYVQDMQNKHHLGQSQLPKSVRVPPWTCPTLQDVRDDIVFYSRIRKKNAG